jgi:hypothetical protein
MKSSFDPMILAFASAVTSDETWRARIADAAAEVCVLATPAMVRRKASAKQAARKVRVALPNQQDPRDAVTKLKEWVQQNKWPEDPAVLAGGKTPDAWENAPRLWHVSRPSTEIVAADASVSAFERWSSDNAVTLGTDDGGEVGLGVVEALGRDALVIRADAQQQLALRKQFPLLNPMPTEGAYPLWVAITGLEGDGPTPVAPDQAGKQVLVVVTGQGQPLADVEVRAQFSRSGYVKGVTDANGSCLLQLPKAVGPKLRMLVLPRHSYWDALSTVELSGGAAALANIDLISLTPMWIEQFRPLLGQFEDGNGTGVVVGVIDTGIAPHPLLDIALSASTVVGETDHLDGVDAIGHGTLVAGVFAARGDGQSTPRGIAPGVTLHAYRVFGRGAERADEAAISKAIELAVQDGCDILNISLGSARSMILVQRAMQGAMEKGVVCVAAAGNAGRKAVDYPACYPQAVAVSAMGHLRAYPPNSTYVLSETEDMGSNELHYLASFTNVGPMVDLCAPGVGIVSTYLDEGFAHARGTSFAAPVITGLLARALSGAGGAAILNAPRDGARAVAMKQLVTMTAERFGFQVTDCEGHGLPK